MEKHDSLSLKDEVVVNAGLGPDTTDSVAVDPFNLDGRESVGYRAESPSSWITESGLWSVLKASG